MKRFYEKGMLESSPVRWHGLAAAAAMSIVSLLLFYFGLPLWAVVIVQVIGSYILYLFLNVAFTRL